MENSSENLSQQSNFMDLSENFENIQNESKIIDIPSRNFGKIDNLRSVLELPEKYRCLFEFPLFNIIQSHVIDDVLYSDVSVVISAPTGSGKTIVLELAIIRLLMKFEETNFDGNFKIVYVAPVKSLCNERLSEWHQKFLKVGISCIVLTGDSDYIDVRCLQNYKIIITTPEKWDFLTRNVHDNKILDSVKLFLIDEVHLLNEETRGPNLEVIVSRMKILKKEKIRFLAVSATIPNINDIAEWLGNKDEPAVYFKIGDELRPVKLRKVVLGYPSTFDTPTFKFDLSLNYKLPNVLMEYSEGKPTLIFCSTRKGVEMTSSQLTQSLTFHLTPPQTSALSTASLTMFDTRMKLQLSHGIGCHHAGMSIENRATVETLFREGHLPVLVATSTLAMGVNLPAHLVVVKNTKQYFNGAFQDYSESAILQMIGRAGRPQFDTKATVVIMTTLKDKNRYEKMLGGTQLIESNLHRHLTEHLNAEIVLGTITDIAIALEWLRYTFLYVRVLKNPGHYNMPSNFPKEKIEKKLQDLCQIEINALNKYGMLQIDQTDGFSVAPTNTGALMANYYLAFNTMKLFMEIKGDESLSEILMLISKCDEFSESYLRANDKKTLNSLNRCKYQETIRFPMKGTIKTTPMKIYCLIQAIFGCMRIQTPSLYQESIKIMRIGERIAKCLVIFLLHKSNCCIALLNALIVNQCFNAKLWENSPYVSRQFPKIGTVLSSMLVSAGKISFKAILETTPRDIERIINRAPPMGNNIHEAVSHLPFYKIKLEGLPSNYKVKIIITLLNAEIVKQNCTAGFNRYMTLLIGDSDNNILCCKKITHQLMANNTEYVQFVDVVSKVDHVIKVYLICENWVGLDCKENYNIMIKQNTITTNVTTSTVNEVETTKNQKTIPSFFKTTKKEAIPASKKKAAKTLKTIDSYFVKQQNTNKNLDPHNCETSAKVEVNSILYKSSNKDTNIKNSSFQNNKDDVRQNYSKFEHLSKTQNSTKNTSNLNKFLMKNNEINKIIKTTQNLMPIPQNFKTSVTFTKSVDKLLAIEQNKVKKLEIGQDGIRGIQNTNNFENSLQTYTEECNNDYSRNINNFGENQNFPEENSENIFETSFKYDQTEKLEEENNFLSAFDDNHAENNEKLIGKHFIEMSKTDENKQLILPRQMTEQSDFESFSQHLAQKFMQPTNVPIFSNFSQNNKVVQNSKPKTEKLEQVKSILSQFQHIPHKKYFNNINKFIQKSNSKFQSSETCTINSQNSDKLNKKYNIDNSITNEELDKFRKYIKSKYTINSTQKNKIQYENNQKTDELSAIEFCEPIYNEESKEINEEYDKNINISIKENSKNESDDNILEISSLDDNTKIILSDNEDKSKNKENLGVKPYFPKTFKEYVQNSIDKLKKNTLVNEYFNYDIGFQEFLMGPLESNSDDQSDEEYLNKDENENKNQNFKTNFPSSQQNSQNCEINSQNSLEFLETENFTFCGDFSTTAENNLTKFDDTNNILNQDFETDNYNYFSPENNNENISFQSNYLEQNINDFKLCKNNETFDNYNEFSQENNTKVENRLKVIENFYNNNENYKKTNDFPTLIPLKRQKLSAPVPKLDSINRKVPTTCKDAFKKMPTLKNIMSTYSGQYENKILLPKYNSNKNLIEEELVLNEMVKRSAYTYSIKHQESETVEMSVCVYQKTEKPIFNLFK